MPKENFKALYNQALIDLDEVKSIDGDFFDSLPIAICELDEKGIIKRVSQSFEDLTGFLISEAVNSPINKFFSKKDRIDALLGITRDDKLLRGQNLTLITKGDKEISVNGSFGIKKDKGFIVTLVDVSSVRDIYRDMEDEAKARTRALEESRRALLNILEDTEAAKFQAEEEKKKTNAIFNNFLDGLMMLDEHKKIELINPKAEELLDLKQTDIIGLSLKELGEINEAKALVKILITKKQKKKDEVFREELKLDNKGVILEITSQPIQTGDRVDSTLIILHDITREKFIDTLKSQFVSVAAHQLRTPLSIIKWSLSMLIGGEMGEIAENHKVILEKANQTNERMIHLINDLLNVARIEEGRFIYKPTTVEFTEIIEAIIDSVMPLIEKKKIILTTELHKDIDKVVKVDIEKIRLAAKNLIDNAIRYTPEGGNIHIELVKEDGKLLFSVKDSGIGIPKEQQERVFTKFFRASNAVRMETEGTGLGLFITKNILESHGGTIWFKSQEKKGTTFFFNLPVIL